MSTLLGRAIELALTAGHKVAAAGAAIPGVEGLVGMATNGARVVDRVDGRVRCTESCIRLFGPAGARAAVGSSLATRDERDHADADSHHHHHEEGPEDRGRHEVGPLPKPPSALMPQHLSSILSRGHPVGLAHVTRIITIIETRARNREKSQKVLSCRLARVCLPRGSAGRSWACTHLSSVCTATSCGDGGQGGTAPVHDVPLADALKKIAPARQS